MTVSSLPTAPQNYLKVVWALTEWSDQPVTTKLLGEKTGLRMSTVSETVKKLTEQGLLKHEPYGAIELTEDGRRHALAMVRRHRLIETFLVEVLGLGWDEVHDEAEELEHAVSDRLIARIDSHLGHPTRDPHGDPIPAEDGSISQLHAHPLTQAPKGRELTVERISDADSELLKFLAQRGLSVGQCVTVQPGEPFSGSLTVSWDGGSVDLSVGVCGSIYVSW